MELNIYFVIFEEQLIREDFIQINQINFNLDGFADFRYLSNPHKVDLKQVIYSHVEELLYLGDQ